MNSNIQVQIDAVLRLVKASSAFKKLTPEIAYHLLFQIYSADQSTIRKIYEELIKEQTKLQEIDQKFSKKIEKIFIELQYKVEHLPKKSHETEDAAAADALLKTL